MADITRENFVIKIFFNITATYGLQKDQFPNVMYFNEHGGMIE